MEEPADENSNPTAVLGEDVVLREREQLSDLLHLLPLRAQLGFSGLKDKWSNRGDKGLKDMISVAAKTNDPLMVEYTCLDVTSKSIVFGSNLGIVYMYDRATRRLSKFICDQKQVPITSIKLLESRSFVATGQFNGAVTLFQYGDERNGVMKVNLKCTVESHHLTPITSIQWTPDGMKLFTADSEGNVAITVINMDEGKTHTVFICKEDSPIVQLSFSHSALLISTLRRTLIWPFTTKKIVQVGMQERKVFGNFGACFFPEAGPLPTDDVVDVYAARPGLRLWRATSEGKVLTTMMFRESINKGKPEIQTIDLQSNLPVSAHGEQRQFGPIKTFHDQFLITWQGSNVWVLDPTTGVVVGCHSNLGCVVDVGVVDNEIFVLSKSKENFVRRILFEVNPCIVVEELDLNNPSDVMKAQRHGSVNSFEDQDKIDKILDEVGNKMGRAFFDVKTRVKGITEQIRSREVSEDDRGSESDRFSSPKAYYKKDAYGERCLATSEGYSTGNGNSTDENDFSDRPFESSSNESFSSPNKSLDSSKSPLLNVTVNETDAMSLVDGLTNVKNDTSDSALSPGQITPTNPEGQQQVPQNQTIDVILTHKTREEEPVFSHLNKEEFAKDIVFEGTSVSTTRKKKKRKKPKKANDAEITDRLSAPAATSNILSSTESTTMETNTLPPQQNDQQTDVDTAEQNVELTQNGVVVNGVISNEDSQQNGLNIQQNDNVVSKHFENNTRQNTNNSELDSSDIRQSEESAQQQIRVVDKPSCDENVEIYLPLSSTNFENNVHTEGNVDLVDGVDKLDLHQVDDIQNRGNNCVENGENYVNEDQSFQPAIDRAKLQDSVDSEKLKTLDTHENNVENNSFIENQQQIDNKGLIKSADDEKLILELNNVDSGVNTSVEDSPHVNSALGDNNITMKSDCENDANNELSIQTAPTSSVQEHGLLTVASIDQNIDSGVKQDDVKTPVVDQNSVKPDHIEPRQTRVKNVRPQRQISSSSDDEGTYVNHRTSLNLSLDDEDPYTNRPSPLTAAPSTKPKLVADSSFDMNVVNVKISHKRQGSNVSIASLTERCREIKGEAIEHNTTPKKAPISAHDDSLEAHLQPHHEPLTVQHHHSADESDEDGKLYPVSPFPPPQTTTRSIYSQRSVSLSELSFEHTQDLGDEDEKLLEDMMEYDRIDVQNDLIESIDSITDIEDNDSPPPVDINDPGSKAIPTPKRKRKKKTRNSYPSSPSSSDLEGRPVNTKDSAAPEAIRDRLRYLADSWAGVVLPEKCGQIQSLACSSQLVWLIDNLDQVYYSPAVSTHVYTWKRLDTKDSKAMHIATNQNGSIVWCIDRNNVAHYRVGIKESTPQGVQWEPFEKNVHYIAVDKDSVWMIKKNGDVFVRTGVSNQRPSGTTWITIKANSDLVQISCTDGIVWALDIYNHVQIFQGDLRTLSVSNPADHDLSWVELPGIAASHVTLGSKAVCWIIDKDNQVWFNQDVSRENPAGGNWYQLSLGENRSESADWFSSVLSYFTKGNEPKQIMANDMAGVLILGKQGSIHVAHGHLLGTTWQSAVPTQIKSSGCWTCISAGGADMNKGYVWTLQPNGQLVCFKSGRQTYNVHPPNRVVLKYCSAGPRSLWALTSGQDVYVRLGISDTCPQGLKWLKVDMLAQGNRRLMNISAGNHVVWAVDFEGNAWFQMGREDRRGAGYAPAWVPVEGCPLDGSKFTKIVVGPDDLIVWACDNKNNVYARKDITENFWVGTSWEVVSGTSGKDIAISNNHVWSLCPNGDVLCRFGVSPNNVCGDYWKKVPGNFEKISVSANDELWGIDRFGHLYQRETLLFYGNSLSCRAPSYDDLFSDHNDWEFI